MAGGGGEVVHESYPGRFAGPRVRFQTFSITKVVTALLAGIALGDGAVAGLDDPVTRCLPDFSDTAYHGATWRTCST